MLFHHCDQHGLRKGKISRIKLTSQGGWLFDQIGDLLQQGWVIRHNAFNLGCQGLDLFLDSRTPLIFVHNDALVS